ncbi:MAG: type VI secretion system baseplate subunit TssG [Limnohabitans sp.]
MQHHTTPAQLPVNLLDSAVSQPWRYGFLSLMRLLDAQTPNAPSIGQSQRPQQETFRLGQQPSLAFAPREIARIFFQNEKAHIHLFGLGMLGPNGALPIHYTELVRERSQARRDDTLVDFLNIFHHRALTHFYRAWSQSQSAAGLDRKRSERFTNYIARLIGDEPQELVHSALPSHIRWACAAHRVRGPRDPEGLVSSLKRFFSVPVKLKEYQLQWISIEPKDMCQLGLANEAAMLGKGAMLGEKVPDRQTKFRLVIGPLRMSSYLRLTPQGMDGSNDLPALVELVRSFISYEYVWEVELLIHGHDSPETRLGGSTQLGWSSWMAQDRSSGSQPITGMIFEPEFYSAKI